MRHQSFSQQQQQQQQQQLCRQVDPPGRESTSLITNTTTTRNGPANKYVPLRPSLRIFFLMTVVISIHGIIQVQNFGGYIDLYSVVLDNSSQNGNNDNKIYNNNDDRPIIRNNNSNNRIMMMTDQQPQSYNHQSEYPSDTSVVAAVASSTRTTSNSTTTTTKMMSQTRTKTTTNHTPNKKIPPPTSKEEAEEAKTKTSPPSSITTISSLTPTKALSLSSTQPQTTAPPPPPPQIITTHQQQQSNNNKVTTTTTAYVKMRKDRQGSIILDLLHAHAYCFHNNFIFGGACATNSKSRIESRKALKLIILLGLEDTLKYDCPFATNRLTPPPKESSKINTTTTSTITNTTDNNFIVLEHYQSDRLFTTQWIDYINSRRSKMSSSSSNTKSTKKNVVIFIRRGDVNPCLQQTTHHGKWYRYLTNDYYINVLDEYLPKLLLQQPSVKNDDDDDVNVTIYSQSSQGGRNIVAENFTIFQDRGYEVKLDNSMEDVWEAIITADVVVLSRSSFSYVPAIFNLNNATILFPPTYWQNPLPTWIQVNSSLANTTSQRQLHSKYGCGGDSDATTHI